MDYVICMIYVIFPLSFRCLECVVVQTPNTAMFGLTISQMSRWFSQKLGKNISVKVEITTFNEGQNVSDFIILLLIVTDDLE